MDAIYIFTERGRTQYAYSKYGGNYATPIIRYGEAHAAIRDSNRPTSLDRISLNPLDVMLELNYNGEYAPQERNGNKVFNRLDDTTMTNDTAYMLMHSGVVGSVIHLDTDKNIVKYNFNNTFGKQDYVLDLSDTMARTINSISELQTDNKKYSIKTLSEYLENSFEFLQHEGKSKDYVMDIVVVEPDTPAYVKRLDISQDKLKAMQSVVQGYIESLPSLEEQGVFVYGNDEARVLEQAPNRKVEGEQAICGTFFICGADENTNSVSLTQDQIHKYTEKYKVPDRFTEQEITAAHRCEVYFFPTIDISYPAPQQTQKQSNKQARTIKL